MLIYSGTIFEISRVKFMKRRFDAVKVKTTLTILYTIYWNENRQTHRAEDVEEMRNTE